MDKDVGRAELDKIFEWEREESDKVFERLKREGKFRGGLDTHQEDLKYIHEERNRRIKELQEKYKDQRV